MDLKKQKHYSFDIIYNKTMKWLPNKLKWFEITMSASNWWHKLILYKQAVTPIEVTY